MVRLEHASLARGDDDAAVPAGRLQVRVQRVFGAVDGEEAVHQVALDLGQAVLGRQQVLHVLLDAVAAETRAQQDGEEHGRRGEEHRVVGDEVAQLVERRLQAIVQHLPQHPRRRAGRESAQRPCG